MTLLNEKFAGLKTKASAIGFSENRQDAADYFEAVFLSANLAAFTGVFEGVFGKALYPSDAPLPAAVKKAIDSRGGIMGKQTLYACIEGNELLYAMLWPWSDGAHITLKSAWTNI